MSDDLSSLNLVELFDRLEPVRAPKEISMLPQTVGWIWLGAAILVLLIYGIWRWNTWRRANAYRRAALAALDKVSDDPVAISAVLRRTALVAYPRERVASLYGNSWLTFLDSVAPQARFLGSVAGDTLTRAPYHRTPSNPDLAQKAKCWIKRHKRDEEVT
ncbi:MAG: DUF4381 domain-containing protein [Ruegeria sp.]